MDRANRDGDSPVSWIQASQLAFAFLLPAGVAHPPYAAAHPAAYAGIYVIHVCHGPCTAATPDFKGTLVLFEHPIRNAQGRLFRAELDTQYANGCFVWSNATGGPFGNDRRGFFSWALLDGAADLELVRSPDGGYGVRMQLTPKGLRGEAAAWVDPGTAGAGHAAQDQLVAERVGEPDIAACASSP
ncbi:hypothetical protein [Rhodanobacter geophilus]|uniref:Uncharacterized protein n=1 Tax=Rhodanobacter geophilus TaxID=3162488 RepID=A0ABV3QN33_9GAMM